MQEKLNVLERFGFAFIEGQWCTIQEINGV